MKNLFFWLASLAFLGLSAQSESGNQYLFHSRDNLTIGGFGGFFTQFAPVGQDFGLYTGGGGAMIVNGTFFVGGYGMGLVTSHRASFFDPAFSLEDEPEIDFGHGGLWLGYNLMPNQLFHLRFALMVGGGYVRTGFDNRDDSWDSDDYEDFGEAAFVLIPTAGVEVNLLPWMKLNAVAGYQYVGAGSSPRPNDINDLNAPVLQLGLMFGYFAH